jgi:pectin methylesterase-like acyl-CoA thioesterase
MQGATDGRGNSKWVTGVVSLLRNGRDVVSLQEVGPEGNVPGQFGHEEDLTVDLPQGGQVTYRLRVHSWNIGTDTRPNRYQVYWLQTDPGGNRVNLAMVTNRQVTGVRAVDAGEGRPALALTFGDTVFYDVHANANGGTNSATAARNIQRDAGLHHWAAMGDWNVDPDVLSRRLGSPAGVYYYRAFNPTTNEPGTSTQQSGGELDYMVSGSYLPGYGAGRGGAGGSDHYQLVFSQMRANAKVGLQSRNDSTFLGLSSSSTANGLFIGGWTGQDSFDNWYFDTTPGGGKVYLRNFTTDLCVKADSDSVSQWGCDDDADEMFYIDYDDVDPTRIMIKSAADTTQCLNKWLGETRIHRGDCGGEDSAWQYAFTSVFIGLYTIMRLIHHGTSEDPDLIGVIHTSIPVITVGGSGQFRKVQDAINAVPADGAPHTIVIAKGIYHETITVPADRMRLTIKGATGNASDVVIYNDRAHGMAKPGGGVYGTQGSATATFRAADLTVTGVKIMNTFNPSEHPEIGPYDTQAVVVAAIGDRQVYSNDQFISTQDTVLTKATAPTAQTRQYFRDVYIKGTVDFLFGDATAVFDHSTLEETNRGAALGGNIVAPNTDSSKKYGILITNSTIASSSAADTFTLGRPWHNTPTAIGQTLIRDTVLPIGIKTAGPWTDMTPDFSWRSARFFEYNNSGPGAIQVHCKGACGFVTRPELSAAQAGDYTAAKYLAGTDGWNPTW